MYQYGRPIIWTDEEEITTKNVIDVLRDAISAFEPISTRIDQMMKFVAGDQPVLREKTFRPDINPCVVDNVCAQVVEFNLGFYWGNPATFVQRAKNKDDMPDEVYAVSVLNEQYDTAGHSTKTQEIARFAEKVGVVNTFIDINTDKENVEDGGAYFTRDVLDPRTSFLVRSSCYPDHRVMLGVTFRKAKNGYTYYTCFSKAQRFEIDNTKGDLAHGQRSGEKNPLGRIPIAEYFISYDRTACWECIESEQNNLNLLISDYSADIEQNTMCVWHTNDVEFEKEIVTDSDGNQTEQVKKPGNGEWLQTFTPQDGKTPVVEPLVVNYDYPGMLNNIVTRRALMLEKCNVPQRNDNSGGSTGVAMSDASGWSAAEAAATKKDRIINGCMIEELKIVLAAIRESPFISSDNPLLQLKYSDVVPNFKRQKTYELTTKTNAIATLLSHGFSLEDCVSTVPLFDDPSQVVTRSSEGVRKYQETIFTMENEAEGGEGEQAPNADRIMQDESDQISNSPNIDGMSVNVVSG